MANDCVDGMDNQTKWVLGAIFALIASVMYSPFFFSLMDAAFRPTLGVPMASPSGCPNFAGLIFVTILYFLVVRLILL